jgi:thiamine biosynthesis lipoprotein
MADSRALVRLDLRDRRMVRVEQVMGTVVSVDVRDRLLESALDDVIGWFHEVDTRFSTYRPDSEISRLSRGELALDQCSSDVHAVLALCQDVHRRSNGVFDVWRHRADGHLDPSALVKGWSVDRAATILESNGARNFCINAGGDVVARGEPATGRRWRVGIRHPDLVDRMAAVVAIRDLAVATSGAYERGDHIVDPRSGLPTPGLVSMTVVGPCLALADAYSTAAFAMGDEGIRWVTGLRDYAGFAVTATRHSVWTDAFDALLVKE